MKNLYPMKISYVAKSRTWGGHELETRYGKKPDRDGGNIGETWELTVREDEMSVIISGECAGEALGDYIKSNKSVLGTKYDGGRFPLLIKFIDACDKLSVQVHPDDEYAKKNEKDPGKTEMWYIIDAKPGAKIVYGLADGIGKAEFAAAVKENRIDTAMGYREVHAGETYFIPSGLLHAIGEGIIIAEIQQNSDLTYRVYDYDRKWNGKLRELHVKQSLDVIKTPFIPEKDQRSVTHTEGADLEHLETCPYYTVEKYDIHGNWEHSFKAGFVNVSVIEGEGTINEKEIRKGDHFIIPADFGSCHFAGNMSLICSWV